MIASVGGLMLGKNCAPFRHQVLYNIISFRDRDDFANLIVISHLVFISEECKARKGNLLVSYDNES